MRTKRFYPAITGLLVCSLSFFFSSGFLHAQVLEEIIVTAQKQEERIQDVGIAISALSGDQLDQLGLKTSVEIANQIPGLVSTNVTANEAFAFFAIRGIVQTDFNDNQEAPVAVYEDEAYFVMPAMSGVPLYDLERVEVLRGPQGTLFGRNATGGLLHFITARPTEEFEGNIKFSAGSYSLVRGEGAFSGPLTENILGRLAFRISSRDGYVENLIGPDVREEDSKAFRGQLLFKLGDNTDLLAKVYGDVQDDPLVGPYQYYASEVGADGISRFCEACGWTANGSDDGNDNPDRIFPGRPPGRIADWRPGNDSGTGSCTVQRSLCSMMRRRFPSHRLPISRPSITNTAKTRTQRTSWLPPISRKRISISFRRSCVSMARPPMWAGSPGCTTCRRIWMLLRASQFPPTYLPAYFAGQETDSIGFFRAGGCRHLG